MKGGVGKTTSAINLAYLSAKEGFRTLLWELDLQGAASFYLGVNPTVKDESEKLLTKELGLLDAALPTAYDELFVIPADLSAMRAEVFLSGLRQSKKKLSGLLSSVKKAFDVIIMDCPPGTSLMHDNIFHAADWILMPNIPSVLSIRSYNTMIDYFEKNGIDTGRAKCFFTMVDQRKSLHEDTLKNYSNDKAFFDSFIPYLSDVEKMGIYQAPVEAFAPHSAAAEAYRKLWNEIRKKCR